MPPTDQYDYTTDQAFLSAPPDKQHAYLTSVDPSYAAAPPEKQKAYLGHINGGEFTEKGAISNPPQGKLPSMPISPSAAIGEGEEVGARENARLGRVGVHKTVENLPTIGTVAGSAIGSLEPGAGNVAGAALGGAMGEQGRRLLTRQPTNTLDALSDTTQQAANSAGAEMGGQIVGKVANTVIPMAKRLLSPGVGRGIGREVIGKISKTAADAILPIPPEPVLSAEEIAANKAQGKLIQKAADIKAGVREAPDEFDIAVKKGIASRIPTKMPKPPVTPMTQSPYYDRYAAGRRAAGRAAESEHIGATPFESLSEQEKAEALMERGQKQGALDKAEATQREAIDRESNVRGNEGRPATWTNEQVYKLAQQGNRDAIMELRQRQIEPPPNVRYVTGDIDAERVRTGPLARTTLETEPTTITPGSKVRGVRVGSPRETVRFDSQGKPIQEPPTEPSGTVGGGGPIVLPKTPQGLTPQQVSPAQDDLENAIRASGQDPRFAEQRAAELIRGTKSTNGVERRGAEKVIQNYMGPERRKH